MNKLHTHTHRCYGHKKALIRYTNFVRNVNKNRYMNLVKESGFL